MLTKHVLFLASDPLCNEDLLHTIPDDHITASSYRYDGAVQADPARGRLNTPNTILGNGTLQYGGWAPTSDDSNQYIQVDNA